MVNRVRRIDGGEGPLEMQVIELPDRSALDAYLTDPVRVALADLHREVIARTDVFEVAAVMPDGSPP